jgi:hypothetical protein
MMHSHKHRIGFIHIPKATGTSIREALGQMFPGGFYEAPTDHMHMQAWLVRDLVLGKYAFHNIRWFAVTRHPLHTVWASCQRSLQVAKWPEESADWEQYASEGEQRAGREDSGIRHRSQQRASRPTTANASALSFRLLLASAILVRRLHRLQCAIDRVERFVASCWAKYLKK